MFFLLVMMVAGWCLARIFFSEATCGFLYADEVADMKNTIRIIESYRLEHGRLPPTPTHTADVFRLGFYEVHADGTYEIHNIGFDGPSISYIEKNHRWRCSL